MHYGKVTKIQKVIYVGIRHGEKVHEDLISYSESVYALETNKYFILYPNANIKKFLKLKKKLKAKFKNKNFIYNSGTNQKFFNIKELSKIINEIKKGN